MKSYDVLSSSSPIYGKLFIEASAGTGKTFAIEHMVLRLVLDSVPINQILVVTFTKAGANDLKKRIHSLLLATSKKLQNDIFDHSYLKDIDHKEEAILLIENACALCNEMPIYTIHGFAFQMLSSFAFEAKENLDLINFEEEKQKDLCLQAILDTLRAETKEEAFCSSHCIKMMDLFQRKLSLFTNKITQLMNNSSKLRDLPTFTELQEHFATIVGDNDYEVLEEEFYTIASDFKKTTNRNKEIQPLLIDQLKALHQKDLQSLLLFSPSIIELLHPSNLKKGKCLNKKLLLPNIIQRVFNIFLEVKNPLFALSHIAKKAKDRLEKLSIKNPDAILYSMKQALTQESFTHKVKGAFCAAIIDEFQDTDPIQWDILSTLFMEGKLFCTVGDPKQSIYAFRGADLPTYLKAKKSFSQIYSLDKNFRSSKLLIDGLNTLFSERTAPNFLSFEKDNTDLTYKQVLAGKQTTADSKLQLYLAPPIKKKTIRGSITETENLYFFPHIINSIIGLDIDFDKIAILVKDRYQGLRVSLALQKQNIPVKANISSSLIHSSMFSLIETTIKLTYHPRNESLIKKLLSHPIIDAPLEILQRDLNDPFLQKISMGFSLLKHILENQGIPSFLQGLIETKIDENHTLGEILSKESKNYQTVMQIFSLLLKNFDKDLHIFISEIKKLNPENFPFLKKQNDTDKKSVTIMTSHLSKGLEFEAIYAISLYARRKTGEEDPQEAFQLDKEKMRLLYVTFTRAKSFLFIYGTFFHKLFPIPRGSASPLELFFARVNQPFLNYHDLYKKAETLTIDKVRSDCPLETIILEPTSPHSFSEKASQELFFTPDTLSNYKQKFRSYSFSSLPFTTEKTPPVDREALFPYGAKIGHQIHLILEKVIEEGLYHPWDKNIIFPVIEKSSFHTPLAGYEQIVYDKIEEIFFYPLEGKNQRFQLKDIPPQNMWPEVLFEYTTKDSDVRVKGFIDLIICINNTFFIIDWKCNHLRSYTKEDLSTAMTHHAYDKQASIYSKALTHFLASKNLDYTTHAGGTFYLFVRGEDKKDIFLKPNPINDEEILCLI